MGAPLPPNAIMPIHWAEKAELRSLPGVPGMESEVAYWIEELSAWIAESRYERASIRQAMGAEAKIIMGKDLK